jgi:hypothetical protein
LSSLKLRESRQNEIQPSRPPSGSRATVNRFPNVAGMVLRVFGSRVYRHPAFAMAMRAVNHSPGVCPRPRFLDRPSLLLRVFQRFSTVLVWMLPHASPIPDHHGITWILYQISTVRILRAL